MKKQASPKRKPLSKKLRFEVFKRDCFKCQYCGASSPDVILHVDHINPVKHGGKNDILNLATSCADCNLGKGATKLDDKSVIEKQRIQLEELSERRDQLSMMLEWREGLISIDSDKENALADIIGKALSSSITDFGRMSVKKWVKKFPYDLLLESVDIAALQYLEYSDECQSGYTADSQNKAFNYIPKICANKIRNANNPEMDDLFYIRGIVRCRLNYCDDRQCIEMLKDAFNEGVSIDNLKDIAKQAYNWSKWKDAMNDLVGEL